MSGAGRASPLAGLMSGPWALSPAWLAQLQAIYTTHAQGQHIDIAAVEARLGRPLANAPKLYQVHDGVAVITLEGILAPKANLFTQVSGGTSTQLIGRQVESAMAESQVRAIVLAIDSPGGGVYGTPELARTVFEAAKTKPIVAYSDATMASAAYWVGSAANAVYVSGPTVDVGGIGIAARHVDMSKARADRGEVHTEITSGKYKRIASDTAPLSAEGQGTLQARTDYLYSLFTNAVAQHRGTDAATVVEHMADGRMFIGQQAIDAGLVDGFASLGQLVAQMSADPSRFASRRRAARRSPAARSVAPVVSPRALPVPAPIVKTRTEQEAEATAYAKRHRVGLTTACKALGFEAPSPTAMARSAVSFARASGAVR